MEKFKRINITLPQSIVGELNRKADESNLKKSHIIAQALELYFDELDTMIAEKRLSDLDSGNAKLVNAEDVWKDLDI